MGTSFAAIMLVKNKGLPQPSWLFYHPPISFLFSRLIVALSASGLF
jgi:hypothetical protein